MACHQPRSYSSDMLKNFSGFWFSGMLISLFSSLVVYVITKLQELPTAWGLLASAGFLASVLAIFYVIDRKIKVPKIGPIPEQVPAAFVRIRDSRNINFTNNSIPRGSQLADISNSEELTFENNEERN